MRKKMFKDLVASVREGSAILRGEVMPSCSFVAKVPDAKRIRANYQLPQIEFAALLGISVKTLRNWEQGRRVPEGPARVLLHIAAKHPEAIWDVVRPTARSKRSKPKRKNNVA